jgi:hypothetical protein
LEPRQLTPAQPGQPENEHEVAIPALARCGQRVKLGQSQIMAYYQHGLERDRLASGARRIEFLRMWDLLQRSSLSTGRLKDVGDLTTVQCGAASSSDRPIEVAHLSVQLTAHQRCVFQLL